MNECKNVVTFFIVLIVICLIPQVVFAREYQDLTNQNRTYATAVDALSELEIMLGNTDNTFEPQKNMTRAEMVKCLVIASGHEPSVAVSKGATIFKDVPENHWASGYINVAERYGYLYYSGDTFGPDESVSFAESITMIIRALGYRMVVESKGTWPINYIAKANDLKIKENVSYNSYEDDVSRGNGAILIWNMLKANMWIITEEHVGTTTSTKMLDVVFPNRILTKCELVKSVDDSKEYGVITTNENEYQLLSDETLPNVGEAVFFYGHDNTMNEIIRNIKVKEYDNYNMVIENTADVDELGDRYHSYDVINISVTNEEGDDNDKVKFQTIEYSSSDKGIDAVNKSSGTRLLFDNFNHIIIAFTKFGTELYGDLDKDNKITILDVRLLLQAYINSGTSSLWSDDALAIMDMNKDNAIDIIDVRLLLQAYINQKD